MGRLLTISELEGFFEKYEPKKEAFVLNDCTKITDHEKFISVSFSFLKNSTNREQKKLYYYRILDYYNKIKITQNGEKND